MEVESIVVAPGRMSALDNGLTHVKIPAIVAPPIPLRKETNRTTWRKEQLLSPIDCQYGDMSDHHSELNGILLCPPLPPREPLRRSVSLTHRPPPPPARFLIQDNMNDLLEPSANHHLVQVPTNLPRTVSRTLARSAPLLDQVIPVSRWPLRDRPTHVLPNRPVHVIPLTRWPLPEATGRLAMDCIVTKVHDGNEYVEGPTSARDRGRPMCTKSADRSPHPVLHLIRPLSEPSEAVTSTSDGSAILSEDVTDTNPVPPSNVEKVGLILRLQKFLRRAKHNPNEPGDCKGQMVCRRCGQCRCSECTRSNIVLHCCGSKHRCSAESAIDVCSCMCCVRPVFYHCLKDENGEEDCSEEPCSCCGRPHCILRWTIMALLAPCLPCLCCYLPLHSTLRSCRACCGGPGCHCPRNLPPGIKGLLESESSNA